MSECVDGVLSEFTILPGRKDAMIRLNGDQMRNCLILGEEDTVILIHGKRVGLEVLLPWLTENRCRVRFYPRIDRYGAATRAEFSPLPEPNEGTHG
jgi:hypothetical protein